MTNNEVKYSSIMIIDEKKLKELGYEFNRFGEHWSKFDEETMCDFFIEPELEEEYINDRGLIHCAYVRQRFIISEQKVIDQIQKAFNKLQEDLKELEK